MKKELVLEPTKRAKKVANAAKTAMLESVQNEKELEKKNVVQAKEQKSENMQVKTVNEKQETLQEVAEKVKPVNEKKKTTVVKTKAAEKKTSVKVEEKEKGVKKEMEAKKVEKGGTVSFFIQYNNKEILTTNILDRVKKAYMSEGNTLTESDKIEVYIKPEENMVYYVVNKTYASGFSLYEY